MTILINEHTRVLVQGITGTVGAFQTRIMQAAGTRIVAGVTPGKGGEEIHGIPVFNALAEAREICAFDAAISFVPGRFALDAALEAVSAGVRLLVQLTEGIPDHDVMALLRYAADKGTEVLGPDTPGVLSPGKSKLGVHPDAMFMPGPVGILSKSGSLSYEVGRQLTRRGIGQSTVVGIGGGPLWGLSQEKILAKFNQDPDTRVIVLLGEVGGTMEHDAAAFIRRHVTKPVVALIVGRTAPPGARMGHAGAIIEGERATASSKLQALKAAGAHIADSVLEIPDRVGAILKMDAPSFQKQKRR